MGNIDFERRQERGLAHALDRTLGDWVEAPNAVDFVPEELDANGFIGAWRVDVDDSTSPAEGARTVYERLDTVAGCNKIAHQRRIGAPLTDGDMLGVTSERGRPANRCHQGTYGCDDNQWFAWMIAG